MVQGVGKSKKLALINWWREQLASNDAARAAFVAARDYNAVANVIRAHAKKTGTSQADAVRLLDSRQHLLNVVDRAVMAAEVSEGGQFAPPAEAATHWNKVKRLHRAKFEKLGGANGVADAKRAAAESKTKFKVMQLERKEREAAARVTKLQSARVALACRARARDQPRPRQ